VKYMYLG